jgi:signal transduction histidine kinase
MSPGSRDTGAARSGTAPDDVTEERSLPSAARLLISLVIGSGALAAAGWLTAVEGWSSGDAAAWGAIFVATAISERFQLELRHRSEHDDYSLSDAIWTGSLLLVAPSVLATAVVAGVLVGEALHRRPPVKLAFNVGQFALAISVALAVFEALGSPPADEPASWLAAAAAMASFQAVSTLLVGGIIASAEARPVREVLLPVTALVHLAGNVATGILGALVWTAQPLGLPLLLIPLALTYLAYRGWLRTLHERDRMAQMGDDADAIARSSDLSKRLTDSERTDAVGQLASTFNHMLAALEASFRRERTFIRESSHELRTPITICRGHLEVLTPQPAPDELLETIAVVLDELDRMTRIADDMSDLAYVEDPASLRPGEVDLERLLADVAVKASPLLNGRLLVEPAPAEGPLSGDSQRLVQALINLIKNAREHTTPDTPIALRAVSDGDAWRFEVADSGDGLAPADEERVFQPFYKSPDSDGSGLGLAIVSGIARAHGGAAGLDNRPGEGATFWIRIPR